MTTKNATTKKSGARKATAESSRESIEERVRAIISDNDRHDYDTRHAVWLALERVKLHTPGGGAEKYMSVAEAHADLPREERELRELIERAEAGEPVGFVWEELKMTKYADAARRVLALMYSEGVPDFITSGIYKTLMAAEEIFGKKLWRDEIDEPETGGWSIHGMAHTFRSHPGHSFEMGRKQDIAGLIAAVLTHKDTPAPLINAMGDALNSLPGYDAVHRTEPHLRELLRLSAEIEKGGKK